MAKVAGKSDEVRRHKKNQEEKCRSGPPIKYETPIVDGMKRKEE